MHPCYNLYKGEGIVYHGCCVNFVQEKKLCASPWIDIYGDGKIQYMAVLAKQLEFYIPEAEKPELDSTM